MEPPTIPSVFDGASMAATVLRVGSVSASVEWYREILGLRPIHVGTDGPDHPIASFMIAGAVVSLWQLPAGERGAVSDPDTSSYVVAVMDTDLAPIRNVLAERGVDVGEIRRSENHEFVWFYDLDGNRFELSRPLATGLD